jgi:two-component system, OmpR family, alkaline phosphatase synthesis response regulator PhoP
MNYQKSGGGPQKVLIVDDDQVIVKTIATKLNDAGYKTLEALDGVKAIALVRKEKPDLIVLDLNFPPDVNGVILDGYDIMDSLRRVKESRTTPIITITDVPDSLDMERNLDYGAVGFLYKPLDYNQLLGLACGALGATFTMAA